MAKRKVLTAAGVEKMKADAARREYPDAGMPGLYLIVQPSGAKSWAFRYRYGSKPKKLTLRPAYPALGLAGAREKVRAHHALLEQGQDPAHAADEQRQEQQRAAADAWAGAVEDFIEKYHKAKKGNRHWKEPRRLLLKHGFGDRPVASITRRDIHDALDGIMAEGKPYLANRVFAAMRTFFSWLEGRERIDASPMRGMERPFDGEAARDRVFSDKEVKKLWKAADALPAHAGAFLKVLLLTGKRKGALAAMRRDEIDGNGIWSPPVDNRRRVGNKRTHAVPLPRLARRIIKGLPKVRGNPHVFVGRRKGGHLDPGTPLQTNVKDLSGVEDFFWHAARHTVETRLAELGVQPHVRDLLLDHAPQRGSGAGYDHHGYEAEMREALEAWAAKVESLVAPRGVKVLR